MRWNLIDTQGNVVSCIIWDGVADYTPPENCRLERAPDLPEPPLFNSSPAIYVSIAERLLANPAELAKLKAALGVA